MLNCIQRNVQVHVTQENSSSLTYSSDFERYYYFNPESGKSSWDYPSGKGKTEDGDSPDGVSIQEHSALDEKLDPVPSVSTPPPGVDITKDPPESIEMWQGPPPPPPPLEEGEVPPTPPSPPHISDESSENEEEEEEAAPYVVAAQPQIYYGPSIPSKEENEVCVCVCVCVCLYVCLCGVYICTYLCVYLCKCTCMCVCSCLVLHNRFNDCPLLCIVENRISK